MAPSPSQHPDHEITLGSAASPAEAVDNKEQPGTVALGGTFDHLHAGHRILLTMACWIARCRVIVGITDDVLLKNKSDRDLLEPLEQRTQKTRDFLQAIAPNLQHDTPALQDVYGPTSTDPDVQAVLVSRETISGATAINAERKKKELGECEVYVIEVISNTQKLEKGMDKASMVESKMSSSAIRRALRG